MVVGLGFYGFRAVGVLGAGFLGLWRFRFRLSV